MLLYIHVPFCRAKCRYCAFYSRPVFDARALDAWAEAIEQDMTVWGEKLRTSTESQTVTSIFFGGGTPSLLSPEQVGRLIDHAAREFALSPDA
ncbi:MAG: coproporphyrinogen III oxidase, partial [Mailhella sp.]|nr:coproporphyrinogen III oxidase [Mailhella sp.]